MDNCKGLGAAMEASSNREKAEKAISDNISLRRRVDKLERQMSALTGSPVPNEEAKARIHDNAKRAFPRMK